MRSLLSACLQCYDIAADGQWLDERQKLMSLFPPSICREVFMSPEGTTEYEDVAIQVNLLKDAVGRQRPKYAALHLAEALSRIRLRISQGIPVLVQDKRFAVHERAILTERVEKEEKKSGGSGIRGRIKKADRERQKPERATSPSSAVPRKDKGKVCDEEGRWKKSVATAQAETALESDEQERVQLQGKQLLAEIAAKYQLLVQRLNSVYGFEKDLTNQVSRESSLDFAMVEVGIQGPPTSNLLYF